MVHVRASFIDFGGRHAFAYRDFIVTKLRIGKRCFQAAVDHRNRVRKVATIELLIDGDQSLNLIGGAEMPELDKSGNRRCGHNRNRNESGNCVDQLKRHPSAVTSPMVIPSCLLPTDLPRGSKRVNSSVT